MNLPNKITLSRIFLIPVFAVIFFLDVIPYNYFISAIVFIVAACTDFVDGHIARSRGLVTNLGKFLDPIADKVLVSTALIFLLVRQQTLTVLWDGAWVAVYAGSCVAIMLARELIVSGFRMVAAGLGLVLAADKLGKVKTTGQDAAIAFLLVGMSFMDVTAGQTFGFVGLILFFASTVLTVLSGVNYIVKNRQVLVEEKVADKDATQEAQG